MLIRLYRAQHTTCLVVLAGTRLLAFRRHAWNVKNVTIGSSKVQFLDSGQICEAQALPCGAAVKYINAGSWPPLLYGFTRVCMSPAGMLFCVPFVQITKPDQHNRWMSSPWISNKARQAQKSYLLQVLLSRRTHSVCVCCRPIYRISDATLLLGRR